MQIPTDKIKDVIGTGGKTINKIIEQTGVKIDIEEDGKVFIYSENQENGEKAEKIIKQITRDLVVGEVYDGTVKEIKPFGAFIDLGGGKEGLLHISKVSHKHIDNINDVLSVGDEVRVKVSNIDDHGKIDLNMRDLENV